MAIYHFSMKTISRSHGRSATAAIAYRAGEKIVDERTGVIHDYQKKSGVMAKGIVLPKEAPEWAKNREQLWNAVEQKETRKNSTVAREIIVALPAELDEKARLQLVHDFSQELVKRHQCAVDYALHEPSKQGDNRNYHAHILMSTRRLTADGFTEKTRELDEKRSGEVEQWREKWANHVNQRLAEHGYSERVSHLSLSEQGIEREATKHKGVAVTAIERRNKMAINGNPDLNLIEKSRLFRAERTQISEQYETVSDYQFDVQRQKSYDLSVDMIDMDIKKQEDTLNQLIVEREQLTHTETRSTTEQTKAVYEEKIHTLDKEQQAKARLYEKLALEIVEHLPKEVRERARQNLYESQVERIQNGKYNAPDIQKEAGIKQKSERAITKQRNRDDWEMER